MYPNSTLIMNKNKKFSVGRFFEAIIIIIIVIIAVFTTLSYFLFKSENSAPNFFGYNVYVMKGSSMSPTIEDGDAVIVRNGVIPENPVGEVVLAKIADGELVTALRVVSVEEADGVKSLYVQSDASKQSSAIKIDSSEVIGHAAYNATLLGTAISLACSSGGLLFFVIIPCGILLLYQLFRIAIHLAKPQEDESEADAEQESSFPDEDILSQPIPEIKTPPLEEEEPVLVHSAVNDKREVAEESVLSEKSPQPIPVVKEQTLGVTHQPTFSINSEGQAEVNRAKPTASKSDLDKVLATPKKANVDTDKTFIPPAFNKPSDVRKYANTEKVDNVSARKEFEESENFFSNPINTVKTTLEPINQEVAPKPKASAANKTLEELMKLLDQEEAKLRDLKSKNK